MYNTNNIILGYNFCKGQKLLKLIQYLNINNSLSIKIRALLETNLMLMYY